MSTNITRYHDRFLSAAASNFPRLHTASFPVGKAWVAGLVMEWVQKDTTVAAREREVMTVALAAFLEVVEPERSALWEAAVVGWSEARIVVELRVLKAA